MADAHDPSQAQPGRSRPPLAPMCWPIEEKLKIPTTLFWSHPDERGGCVQYGDLTEASKSRSHLITHEAVQELYEDTFPNGGCGFADLKTFIGRIADYWFRGNITEEEKTRRSNALHHVAISILRGADVHFRSWDLFPGKEVDGPEPGRVSVVLDWAEDFTHHQHDGKSYPDAAVARSFISRLAEERFREQQGAEVTTYRGPLDEDEFQTNWTFNEDCTQSPLFIRTNYLARGDRDYISEAKGTFLPFFAEAILAVRGDVRQLLDGDGTRAPFKPLHELEEIHFPIESMGQYRGFISWFSTPESRDKAEKKELAKYFDCCLQKCLSQTFSLAIIDAFEAAFDAALTRLHRAHETAGLKGFYEEMALAFGLLFWAHQVDFFKGDDWVACRTYSNDQAQSVTLDPPPDRQLKYRWDGGASDDTVWVHRWTRNGRASLLTLGLDNLDPHRILPFDRVRITAHKVSLLDKLAFHAPTIERKIGESLQRHWFAMVQHLTEFVGDSNHQLKGIFSEIGSSELVKALEEEGSPLCRTAAFTLSKVLDGYAVVEMNRARSRLVGGALPSKWLDSGWLDRLEDWRRAFGEEDREMWRVALEQCVRRMIPWYRDRLRQYKIQPPLELSLLEVDSDGRIRECLVSDEESRIAFEAPPFGRDAHQGHPASMFLLTPLSEIVRNALKIVTRDEDAADIHDEHGKVFVAYRITSNSGPMVAPNAGAHTLDTFCVEVWNPLPRHHSQVGPGSSLSNIIRMMERLDAVEIHPPSESRLPAELGGGRAAISRFIIKPTALRFEAD